MKPRETRAATRDKKLSELRGQFQRPLQQEDLAMQMWWEGVLFGRLSELEACGVFTTEERQAFEAEMKAASNKLIEDEIETLTGRRVVLPNYYADASDKNEGSDLPSDESFPKLPLA